MRVQHNGAVFGGQPAQISNCLVLMPKTQHGQAVLSESAANVQALLEHGKLRTDQINSVVAALQASDATALGDAVVTCLGNLVQSRYVQRARGCNAEKTAAAAACHRQGLDPSSCRGPCT